MRTAKLLKWVHWQVVLLSLLCREPAREVPPMTKVMWRGPEGKGESGLEGPPGPAQAPTPKPESVLLFYDFHQLL